MASEPQPGTPEDYALYEMWKHQQDFGKQITHHDEELDRLRKELKDREELILKLQGQKQSYEEHTTLVIFKNEKLREELLMMLKCFDHLEDIPDRIFDHIRTKTKTEGIPLMTRQVPLDLTDPSPFTVGNITADMMDLLHWLNNSIVHFVNCVNILSRDSKDDTYKDVMKEKTDVQTKVMARIEQFKMMRKTTSEVSSAVRRGLAAKSSRGCTCHFGDDGSICSGKCPCALADVDCTVACKYCKANAVCVNRAPVVDDVLPDDSASQVGAH